MSKILKTKQSMERKPYDRENLKRAFKATLSGMSVYRASRVYSVPESTLRDRTRHIVELDCKPGPERLFSNEEEKQLADNIVYMARIGYGYTISDIQYMAADYARSIGKKVQAKEGLSQGWFYAFLGRWDQLKVVSPQKLGMSRAKCASRETISKYFCELESVLKENHLLHSPERIFNVDESGFSTEHTPPKIVFGKDSKAQSVTSSRTKNVTVIGCASAIGNYVPPYYIFPGKRWNEDLMKDCLPGSSAGMSESGWVNRGIFETYIINHFSKYVGLSRDKNESATLILYDGHKSHLSLTLTNWAKEHNVILFVLPPHSSHLTQPLDVGVFGPMKKYFYRECKTYMHSNPGMSVTKYEIAKLTAKPYARAFSPENVISSFRKAGIYPFDKEMVNETQTAPASIYHTTKDTENSSDDVNDTSTVPMKNVNESSDTNTKVVEFFDSRKITSVVQRPKKKFVPPIKISRNLLSEQNTETIKSQHEKRLTENTNKAKSLKKSKPADKKIKPATVAFSSPKPSTFGVTKSKGAPIDVYSSSDEGSDTDEPCCVYQESFPSQLRGCASLVIVKWGQCDCCGHWVHLTYCNEVRVLRRGSTFRCVHCPEE